MIRPIVISLACAALASCGGGSNHRDSGAVDYSKLQQSGIEAKVLKPATEGELATHLKNGIRLNINFADPALRSASGVDTLSVEAVGAPSAAQGAEADAAAFDSAASSEFSATNTHVRGVDEADYVKYDGRYIYMATAPEYVWAGDPIVTVSTASGGSGVDATSADFAWAGEYTNARVRILETDPASAGVNEVGSIDVADNDWGEVGELYLVSEDDGSTRDLVTLRSAWNYLAAAEPTLDDALFTIWPQPLQNRVQLTSYNVVDPSQPSKDFSVEIDGYLQASRKIGNTLYLVTNFSPYLPNIEYYLSDEGEIRANEQRIADLSLDQLLPSVRVNGGADQPLHQASDCYVPVDLAGNSGYHNIVSLIAIDLASQQITAAKCLNTQVSGIYSSTQNIYLGASDYAAWNSHQSFTVVHKFALADGGISYRSTGVVPGYLGWQDPSFRMDEYQGDFRIITSERDANWNPLHQLNILRDAGDSDEMAVIASLPNDAHPEPLGKPNEDIYAVRFHGERAFVVTFERIDPLYLLDLSDPQDPYIAAALEVPGVSTYLHPVGDNYLLGIGNDASDSGVISGIKTSLYNISDINAPVEVNSLVIGDRGSWSPAIYDLRAISFVQASADQLRFAFAISSTDSPWNWQEEALHLFEINGLAGASADLVDAGKIVAETRDDTHLWPSSSGTDRSVLHDEAVYYTHGGDVWAAFWSSPAGATGPH